MFEQILWLLSWPIMIYISYLLSARAVKKFQEKYETPENES